MQQLTEHEKKILELVKKHPEIVDDRSARKKIADEVGISEKTLRNRIADLKRYGLIGQGLEEQTYNKKDDTIFVDNMVLLWKKRRFIFLKRSRPGEGLRRLHEPRTAKASSRPLSANSKCLLEPGGRGTCSLFACN